MSRSVFPRCLTAAAVLAAVLLAVPAPALADCGDGILDSNEECDSSLPLFIDGDPAGDSCTNGARCYFQFTCCKFNCQYVGTPGSPCQDGNNCTGPDTCNQVGVCLGGPGVANGTPCDDGLFCTGVEDCQDGECLSSTGDPCPGTACNQCQEATDSCLNPAGSPCDDGNGCVDGGTCDGAGTCSGGTFNTGACDDGLFCNGTDTCSGGTCSVHTNPPCVGVDGDGDCEESCDEESDVCDAPDPDGASCDDGVFCNGSGDECTAGVCSGAGLAACDDENSCTGDTCDEGLDSCLHVPLADGTGCDDGQRCTLGDLCEAGVCVGAPPLLEDLCPWTVVMRENPKRDQIRTNFKTLFDGDTCAGTVKFAYETTIVDDLVVDEAEGEYQVRLAPDAVVGGEIASAGGGARAFPGSDLLPYTAVTTLAPGSVTPKSDASGDYDLSGMDPLVAPCHAARTSFATASAALDALTATSSVPALSVPLGGTSTIAVSTPGGVNVIDIEGRLKLGKDAILELDGGGDPSTVVILRIADKMQMLLSSQLLLVGGLTPDRVLIYAKGKKCQISDLAFGGGTVLCTPGRLKTGRTVAWLGAFFADGKLMKIGERTVVLYQPFQGY